MRSKAFLTLLALTGSLAWTTLASAHAELETAVPAPDSTVAEAPLTLDMTFSEEVASDGLVVTATGPAGDEVQASTAELDLNDPQRQHVTLSLRANLPDGRYIVAWRTTSGIDGDQANGSFLFTVSAVSASPATTGSPAAMSPVAVTSADLTAAALPQSANGNPLAAKDGDFDARALALSVGAGLIAIVAIALVWRAVRPRDPLFGGRSGS